MKTSHWSGLRMRMGAERAMLMLPLNVVMSARVQGAIDPDALRDALAALRKRHAFLGVRVGFDANHVAWFEADGVPEVPVREGGNGLWAEAVDEEMRTPFPLETGPLFRVTVLGTPEGADLIVTGHHVVCDGMSITWLVRDILAQLEDPARKIEALPAPPPIDETTVPSPKRPNAVARWVMERIRRHWERQGIGFGQEDMERMHSRFRAANGPPAILRWEFSVEETNALLARCRAEGVTVNSALWAAFLVAQQEILGDTERYRRMAGMAVSTRDKLTIPVGEALGFFASSLSLPLRAAEGTGFWDTARQIHAAIKEELARTDLFRMLAANALPPTLLDALYFVKYDGFQSGLATKMLRKLKWDRTSFGFSITNVGRVDIPTEYGRLRLDAVHGPLFYSDVNEKVVGVTTVGGRLACAMTCRRDGIGEAAARSLQERATELLRCGMEPGV